ncbi:hypothetical protein DL95DRAFT_496530 [Leptodontidium sp. 2 PMI_412]|nr:hypothetical protein DL95DRAFT_496530 [Leptodontidium sp. 2 PMI_412]
MLRRLVLSLIATKNYNRVTKHVVALKPSIVARSFHISPLYHSNCDFGRPCQCTECRENAQKSSCEQEIEQKPVSCKKRMDDMMEYVRGIHPAEQVPIGYAVEKFLSDTRSMSNSSKRWHQRHLIDCLWQDLQIVKVRNRYMCDKRRVEAMDFKLWSFYRRPDIDV